jgi:hypothetical protein
MGGELFLLEMLCLEYEAPDCVLAIVILIFVLEVRQAEE